MLLISIFAVSLFTLVATFFIWRDTTSRPSLINGVFASLALLITARLVSAHTNPDMAVGLPILAGMLLLGRGMGTWWRARKEPALKHPATLWLFAGAGSLGVAAAIYYSITHAS
jgi:uncharacterized membrane protein (UPF0136 family)